MKRFLKQIAITLTFVLLITTPAMAATMTASKLNIDNPEVKELNIKQEDSKYKKLIENEDFKLLERYLKKGNFKASDKHLLEIKTPTDKEPTYGLFYPYARDGKPGYIGIVMKNEQVFVSAVQGEATDQDSLTISVTNLDKDKKINTKVKKFSKSQNKVAGLLFKQADASSLCVSFCSWMSGAGYGLSCSWACTVFTGGWGIVLCPAFCYGGVYLIKAYGCPWYCNHIGL